ncbi:MAG: hypothetical protein HQL88_07210 [Magnetococcales bacterium]|nr:hypothetical protein [Magnetococcales bacterium]
MFASAAGGQEEPACPALNEGVEVDVRFEPSKPFVDDSRSRAWIQDVARALHHPIGVTASRLSHTLTAHFLVRVTADRRSRCLYLKTLTMVLAYPNTTVYIDNAYRPGSCEYQAIYQHEMEHVRILNTHQTRFLPTWRSRLQALARDVRPLLSDNPQQTQQEVLQKLDQVVKKEIERLDKFQKAEQGAIDTPRNYAKVRASCQAW